jgi:hypothetical protein
LGDNLLGLHREGASSPEDAGTKPGGRPKSQSTIGESYGRSSVLNGEHVTAAISRSPISAGTFRRNPARMMALN